MIRVKSTAWALLASIPLVIHTLVYWRAPISPSAERFFHSLHGHWRGFGGYTGTFLWLVCVDSGMRYPARAVKRSRSPLTFGDISPPLTESEARRLFECISTIQ